jgi:hypothetical protein
MRSVCSWKSSVSSYSTSLDCLQPSVSTKRFNTSLGQYMNLSEVCGWSKWYKYVGYDYVHVRLAVVVCCHTWLQPVKYLLPSTVLPSSITLQGIPLDIMT